MGRPLRTAGSTARPILIIALVLGGMIALGFQSLIAQSTDIELPEYTDEQRWRRAATGTLSFQAALIAMGRERGMSAEEVGVWVGEFFSQAWVGGLEARQLVVGMYRNHMSSPGASAEILETSPTTVKARFNRPMDPVIGADRQHLGVSADEFYAMYGGTSTAVADWVGVELTRDSQDDHDVLTMTTQYGPIQISDRSRWGRQAGLSSQTWYRLLELRMQSGMTAREVGQADGELYGPGWSSTTPWSLFRGMVRNQMGDPTTDCEVLSGSPDEVRGRCVITAVLRVRQSSNYVSVTVEDVLESGRAFAESVAEQRGMVWEESWDDTHRTIRVTRR